MHRFVGFSDIDPSAKTVTRVQVYILYIVGFRLDKHPRKVVHIYTPYPSLGRSINAILVSCSRTRG